MSDLSSGAGVVDVVLERGFPINEFILNALAIIVSLAAIMFWIGLYRRVYKESVEEVRGWSWLFASAVGILPLNISSIYMLFNIHCRGIYQENEEWGDLTGWTGVSDRS